MKRDSRVGQSKKTDALGNMVTNMPALCHRLPSRTAIDGVPELGFPHDGPLRIDSRAGLVSLE